ncbi:TadE family protein [Actimicrobium antarcticum]
MIEFAVAGPLITLLGLAMLQYGMLYFARNEFNQAAFSAARAGAVAHASLDKVQQAYIAALVPMHGGGQTAAALATARIRASDAVTGSNLSGQNPQGGYARITLLNPTKESFSDWNSPELQRSIGAGSRVIPNTGLAFRRSVVKTDSGQSIQDANRIKLRIVHGYQPKIALMGILFNRYLASVDTRTDPVQTDLLAKGLIPVVSSVVLDMQSDAIERLTVSSPGGGNSGSPIASAPVPPRNAPDCISADRPASCLPAGCTPGDIQCDPICNSPDLCCMPSQLPQ